MTAAAGAGNSSSNRWTHSARASAAAMPSHALTQQVEPIAPFCDFLELRVATKNMALLRRIASDLFVGHEQTLKEFVELGVNLIAVLPFEELDPTKRAIAAQILFQQQRHSNRSRSSPGPSARSHSATAHSITLSFLEARVETKNMPWLKCIYSEFCDGREDALCDFVRSGLEAISVLPIRGPPPGPSRWLQYAPSSAAVPLSTINHQLQMAPRGSVATPSSSFDSRHTRATAGTGDAQSGASLVSPQLPPKTPPPRPAALTQLKTPLSPALHKSRKDAAKGLAARPKKRGRAPTASAMRKSPKRAHQVRASSHDSTPSPLRTPRRNDREGAAESARGRDSATTSTTSAAQDQVERDMAVIRTEFFRIEAAEPWRSVFHDHLALPPPVLRFGNLAKTLEQFFVRHGRAVWERKFWLPLSRTRDVVLSLQRTKRQQSAKKIYIRRVLKVAYKVLGAAFFLALDAHRTPYDGWWYRTPVMDLGTLYRAKGLAHTLAYLRQQHAVRFPDAGAHMLSKARGYHSWSASMWSSDVAVAHILQHIRVLKGTAEEEGEDDGDGGKDLALRGDDEDADADDSDGDEDADDNGVEDVDYGDDAAADSAATNAAVLNGITDSNEHNNVEYQNDNDEEDEEETALVVA